MAFKITTVRLRVADLGFPEGALTRELIGSEEDRDVFGNPAPFTGGRGKQMGLELCSSDIGPALRLEYSDQPKGERLYIAMRPIRCSDGEPRIFVVLHGPDGLALDAARARPADEWAASELFVFQAGRPETQRDKDPNDG